MLSPKLLAHPADAFPDPEAYDAQGLVAVGGDLSPERLLQAYKNGIFPWFDDHTPLLWWSPDPRLVLFTHAFKVSSSFSKTLKKKFRYTLDQAFEQVIHYCATTAQRQQKTWITQAMQTAYIQLHKLGYAHSVEVWHNEQLCGGLYGISLGHAFFGESMFYLERDASKLALYYLCHRLSQWGFQWIDCQLPTPHLKRLGATEISRQQFLKMLRERLQYPTKQGKWG